MTRYFLAMLLMISSLSATAIETDFVTDRSVLTIPELTIDQLPTGFDVEISLNFETGIFGITDFTLDPIIPLQVILSGSQTVPALASEGAGLGLLRVNQATGDVSGIVLLDGFGNGSTVTMAHIHVGDAGATGPIAVDLPGNNHVRGVPKGTRLSSSQLDAFTRNGLYINVHTEENPAGEIRGQLLASRLANIQTNLNGSQSVPANSSNATGSAVLTVNLLDGSLSGEIMVNGLSSIDSAHIHVAAIGENGPVVVPLDIVSNTMVRVPAGTVLEVADLVTLLRGQMYYNIHTPEFPDGEIRGQIERSLD